MREVLRHARHGVVDRHIAVRVIFAQHLADDAGRLFVGAVGVHAHVVHGVEDAAVHRLQAVARVGQGPRHDHAHGVVQIRAAHLVVNVDTLNLSDLSGLFDFFFHAVPSQRMRAHR